MTQAAQLPAAFNTHRLPAHVSLDLHIARVFTTSRGPLTLFADITNATNHRNVIGHRYEPDLTRVDALSLPIVPSIGLRWEW